MKEEDIRKRDVFNRYLQIVADDVKALFDFNTFVPSSCPACHHEEFVQEFVKNGFRYVSCTKCETLFVNPRPCFGDLKKFYAESSSTSYWVNEFFMPVAEIRREKIFKPRAEYIGRMIQGDKGRVVGDVGAGFGIFLEELRKLFPGNNYIAIEPSPEMASLCLAKGLVSKCMCLEDIDDTCAGFDLLTAFELLEHLYDPEAFLRKAHSLLNPQGYLYLTTLNGKGFDIALLWDRSKSVVPPHHLNFFTTESIALLAKSTGYQVVEISTPGRLDWDIVEGMITVEGMDLGRFWNSLARSSDSCKEELQQWISKNNLSSHMRVLLKKEV